MHKFVAHKNDGGRKLIKYISSLFKDLPESRIYKLLRQKCVKINGKRITDSNHIINEGDEVVIYGIKEQATIYIYDVGLQLDSKIIYEDDNILIINKKAGKVVHGELLCLDNQVLSYLKFKQNSSFKPSHVGRLDKWTSGLIVYAKNYKALRELNDKIGFFDKIYTLKSDYNGGDNVVSAYIHHDEKMQKMIVTKNPAGLNNQIVKTKIYVDSNKLYAQLLTGRKHQIRATMEYLGYPIYGDIKYGWRKKTNKRIYLHSYKLGFNNLSSPLEYLNGREFECNEDW
ncbi:RluA family pseudouridine synthase [Mycoplasmopsis bovis]|uniref:RNA pseudouridylate synthase n=2 Tax=Mycoplasmopsis bovis TaxID=28903 RepID=A0A2N8U3K2_MYCBV|nr:RluA family pseudouridine synthase [Mycoplasmopsis bovis]ADR24890.1 ribosomal large subunit pseudouridine synthase, RluA family [Mycoplasmopsis bovis PG45]AXJ70353.1 pseudouridine synthase [Mycoplasmopsis bovis]MBT1315576.1 RluA family pseudouridine synthase [Mycoplasmopsis bovis]MBT1317054.1 RluA family pseudouridine synthase [Mycoplasmopsis bovis]MBT1320739.1 RluA family pseudouridine synthase [Mycoplasmopsis bovis]